MNATNKPFELYTHQNEIVARGEPVLATHGILCLILQPRVGKTLIALRLALNSFKRCLVLTKKAAIVGWEKDIKLIEYHESIKVTNYEQAHKLEPSDYDIVILDESHANLSALPKMGVKAKRVKLICQGKPIIYLTATPQAESGCQWFHQLAMSSRSPWSHYRNFYKWFADYGIKDQMVIQGRTIQIYKKGQEDKILNDIKHLIITKSQSEAGFDIVANDKIHLIENPELVEFSKQFKKDRIAEIVCREIVADTPPSLIQKLHQFCGGTVICEDGEPIRVSTYKIDYIKANFPEEKIVILCQYREEIAMLLDNLESATSDPEEFRNNPFRFFVGQIKKYSEGVDFSYAETMIIYSLNFSATTYIQSRDRLCNKARLDPVTIHYLMARGCVDEYVYKAVKSKENFTSKYYERTIHSKQNN